MKPARSTAAGHAWGVSELPSRLLRSSDALGWRQVHASTWRDPPVADEFRRAPTPDLTVVLGTSGQLPHRAG
jgi:hypothetical protein